LESAEEGLKEDFEELVKQEQNPTSEEILEQQIDKEIADLTESLGTPEANSKLTETEIEEAEEIEELYNDLYKLAVDTDNAFDETQFKQIGAIKNYDGQVKDEIIETLIDNGVLEEDGATLSLSADDMGEINWKMIKGNLSDCV
jgi:beta-N-acetylglucosaminidase